MTTPSSSTSKASPRLGCFLYVLIALFGAAVGYRANDYSPDTLVLGGLGLAFIVFAASEFWEWLSPGEPYESPKRGCATFFPIALLGSSTWAFGLALLASRPFWEVMWESLAAGMLSAAVFYGLIILFKLHFVDKTKATASSPWVGYDLGCLDGLVLFFLFLCKTVFDLIFGRKKD